MMAEMMAVCWNLLRWNIRETVINFFEADMCCWPLMVSPKIPFALILIIPIIWLEDSVLKIDLILPNTSATRTLMFVAATVEFKCIILGCRFATAENLISCFLNNYVSRRGLFFVHRCVRSTTIGALGFFRFPAKIYCVLAWAVSSVARFYTHGGVSILLTLEALFYMFRLFAWFTSVDQPINLFTLLLCC